MSTKEIKKAFDALGPSGNAALLRELMADLARSLAAEDSADSRTMALRRGEEARARPWNQVRAGLVQKASGRAHRRR